MVKEMDFFLITVGKAWCLITHDIILAYIAAVVISSFIL